MFDQFKRRSFLQAVVAVAASTAFGCSDDEEGTLSTDEALKYFPQSVASGDPRPDSVVLWVRAVNPDAASSNTTVRLEVSTSQEFTNLVLNQDFTALSAHDHALKVKVTNLSPRTTYYYRFTVDVSGQKYTSNVGRTRTAPATGDNVPVKFAFASCQDYIGRYYNAWQRLLQLDEDLDFVVFLGDYIYETTGDASFQSANGQRTVVFSDTAGALRVGTGLTAFYAANTVSNYRDLYKNLRTDKVIQQVHERYPFIVMWDDHEFSDDSWRANATYTDGRVGEEQVERRRNAEQAFFEYIPLDNTGTAGEGAIDVDAAPRFPDTRIYRDFDFGANLKLVVTDYRTYRPDHLIPEDAYPGAVVMTQAQVQATIQGLPLPDAVKAGLTAQLSTDTFAYVNLDDAQFAVQKAALQGAYVQQAVGSGLTQQQAQEQAGNWVKGNVALFYANQVLAAVNQARVAAGQPAIPAFTVGGTSRGIAYVHMGKSSLFTIQGSRYIVVKPIFDLYAGFRYATTAGASQDVLNADQQAWLQNTTRSATNTWKVIVSSVSFTAMIFDLSNKTDIPDPNLRQTFYFNADQWDGFPTKKQELLGFMRTNVPNSLFISGDIHASFASVESGVPTLTAPAISSGSIKELAGLAVIGAGYATGSPVYKYVVAELEKSMTEANPGMRFVDGDKHGFVVVEVKSDEAIATYHLIPSSEIAKDYSLRDAAELEAKFTSKRLRVQGGNITEV